MADIDIVNGDFHVFIDKDTGEYVLYQVDGPDEIRRFPKLYARWQVIELVDMYAKGYEAGRDVGEFVGRSKIQSELRRIIGG